MRFGILFCVSCVQMREFVSYSKKCKHITDAFCCQCGYSFGRTDQYDELAGMRPGVEPGADPLVITRGVAVIDDATAAEAAARLEHGAIDLSAHASKLLPPSPPPWRPGLYATPADMPAEPEQVQVPRAARPAAARSAPDEPQRARADEFMRYFERDRT